MPNHLLTLELLSHLSFSLAAPSANSLISISPIKSEHVKNYFDGKLNFILDGGICEVRIESTIICFKDGKAMLYRRGSCDISEIDKFTEKLIFSKKDKKKQKLQEC
ncbi:L-threonylcarbamoyladenylate synthase [Flavobacterium sp. SM2513]|uniref:L-threonylcarbamoyladenylate synthase n=1 Tax=Flavobacterium sp. SM2513 TaxID=3424766 RepID=UPI003D7FA935